MPITHDCAAVWEQGCLHEDIEIFNLLCRHLSLVQIINFWKFHEGSTTISTFSEEAAFCGTSSALDLETLL